MRSLLWTPWSRLLMGHKTEVGRVGALICVCPDLYIHLKRRTESAHLLNGKLRLKKDK